MVQLFDAVEKLCTIENPDRVEDVDLHGVTTFFPLIIIRDGLGSAFFLSAYLNLHFQELVKTKKFLPAVTPLPCVLINDLEQLSPYPIDTPRADTLAARYSRDKSRNSPFWAVENSALIQRGNRPPTLLIEEGDKLQEMVAARLGLKE